MRVANAHVELTDDEVVLCADIESADSVFEARIGVDRHYIGIVDQGTNPFVPVATLAAAVGGEDLTVEGPISPMLRDGAQDASQLFHEWWGHRAVSIHGPTSTSAGARGTGRGLFFTRGVDSLFSLLSGMDGIIEPFTHLIGVADLDHWVSPQTRAATWTRTETFAHDLSLPIIRVTSNLREFLDPLADWNRTHGAFLASVALALSPLLRSVVVSSTHHRDHAVPLGTHGALDPLWSTESTTIHHFGSDTARIDKVSKIAERPPFVDNLKVCWLADVVGNCGRCDKCLRTMTSLVVAGFTGDLPFDSPLSRSAILETEFHHDYDARNILDEFVPRIPDAWSALRDAWARVARDFLADANPNGEQPEGPVCLPRDTAHAVLASIGEGRNRPTAWCVVDEQSAGAVALADRLTQAWGTGLCYLSGVPWAADQPPGLPSVERILRAARVRVWWSDGSSLDVEKLRESVVAGCAPLQVMTAGAAEVLRRRVPNRLRDSVVGWDPDDPPDLPDESTTDDLIRRVVSELVVGSPNAESVPSVA